MSVKHDLIEGFKAGVARNGYTWLDTSNGPVMVERPIQGCESRKVLPFAGVRGDSPLYVKFAELPPTQDAVLAFANEYGFLGRPVTEWWPMDSITVRGELFDGGQISEDQAR